MDNKVILITGASSGIGKACAQYLSKKGHKIYGTTRNISLVDNWDHTDKGYEMMVMDVVSLQSVSNTIKEIIEKEKKIDVLINNAGMGVSGSIEETEYMMAKNQFETNFFGCHRVIKEVLPHMRKQRNGLIINIGSVAAYISIPFQSMYSASKSALQSLTFALRNEVRPFGINVTIIHPGDLKTEFTANRKKIKATNKHSPYAKSYEKAMGVMEKDEQEGGDPICVAKAIEKVIKRKNPPISLTVGFKYKTFAFLLRLFPSKTREKIVALIYT